MPFPVPKLLRHKRASGDDAVDSLHHRASGDRHRDAKEWGLAAEAYGRHVELNPEDQGIWVQLGNCLKEAGSFERAFSAYTHAKELDPDSFDVHLQLGHLSKIVNRYPEALGHYEQAALLDPKAGEVQHEIRAMVEKTKASVDDKPAINMTPTFTSLPQLVEFLKLQREEDDMFARYFRSINGG